MKPHPDNFPPKFDRYAPEWKTGTTWTDREFQTSALGNDGPTREQSDLFTKPALVARALAALKEIQQ